MRHAVGDKKNSAGVLHSLAVLAQDMGDLAEARRLYDQSLQLKHELGDKRGIASTLHQIGRVEEEEGNLDKALGLFEQSFKMLTELSSPDAKIAERSLARVRERLEKAAAEQQISNE